jgi:hypothetical protein
MNTEAIIDVVLYVLLIGIWSYMLINGLRRGRRVNTSVEHGVNRVPPSVATLAARRARQASAARGWQTRRSESGKAVRV